MELPKHEGNRIIIAMVLQVDPNSEVVQMIYFMMFWRSWQQTGIHQTAYSESTLLQLYF